MAGDSSSYLEKISPKDLVFFSPATRKIIAKVSLPCPYLSVLFNY
jgi:hypothetical protein